MNKLILAALLCLPAAAFCQDLTGEEPGAAAPAKLEEIGAPPPARPNPQKIMSEISAALRLSSKQEDRISAAMNKKAAEFDKLMKEFERTSAEEKKWRFKMNDARRAMAKLTRDLPDTVREYLDDEQRESFDELIESRRQQAGGSEEGAAPAKKKKMIKRKKAPAPEAGPADGEEAGQTMVDKEAPKAGPKRKLVKRKKGPAPKAAPAPAPEEPAAEEPAAEAPPAEEDAGSYP